jgi:HPt (histidine-containing phosphotransfer) domain-containing protein
VALDLNVLKELVAEPGLQLEVLKTFNSENTSNIVFLKVALLGEDTLAIVTTAHRIKGAAHRVGAKELEVLSLNIEHAAKQSDLNGTRAAASQLDAAVQRVETEIARFCADR